jgi:hypothetical protein
MSEKTFKRIYAISNWFYKIYFTFLAKRLVKKLLNIEVAERRKFLLSNQFVMISYHEEGEKQIRVYRHRSGLKITDTYEKQVATK